MPLYFTIGEQVGARNDFLNRKRNGKTLTSFGVHPGGYIGFFDPQTGDHETYVPDAQSKKRQKIKAALGPLRRAPLYRQLNPKRGPSPRLEPKLPRVKIRQRAKAV